MQWLARRGAFATVQLVTILVASLVAAACTPRAAREGALADARYIGTEEIDSAHVSTAYDAITKLRPQFLMSRGKLSLDPRAAPALPRVYVDDQFYGDAATLRGILTATIESIRYYSSSSAQQKFGHDNAAGVIAIATKH